MRAGRLNQRISIQSRTVTRGTSGGISKVWTALAEVRAGVKNMSGNERQASSAGGQIAEARTEFTIRYLAGVTTDMRVLYEGRVYMINHVNDLMGGHATMILTCDTGVSDG